MPTCAEHTAGLVVLTRGARRFPFPAALTALGEALEDNVRCLTSCEPRGATKRYRCSDALSSNVTGV